MLVSVYSVGASKMISLNFPLVIDIVWCNANILNAIIFITWLMVIDQVYECALLCYAMIMKRCTCPAMYLDHYVLNNRFKNVS